jgi:hypothetical protein
MQTDMHYYGTYAIARAAGFRQDIAQTIAIAAEYVDDSDSVDVVCKDGFQIRSHATAHHPLDMPENTDPEDQKRTWVPFHFIPGLQGDTVDEKLVCVTDSPAVREVVANTLAHLDKRFSVPLLGILAHSFIDTFSHYGFSGISSKWNRVDPTSFNFPSSKEIKATFGAMLERFRTKFAVGPAANFLVQLGHGSVATFPDQPFLTWEFIYESPRRTSSVRNNPHSFLSGCRRLHAIFSDALKQFDPIYLDSRAYRDFDQIEGAVSAVLAVQGDDEVRAAAWKKAVNGGLIAGVAESIPEYDSDRFTSHLSQLWAYDEKFAVKTLTYQFLEAADFHRNFILNNLLPRNNVHIEAAPIEWHT